MHNIFVKTIWDYRRSIIFWGLGIFLLVLMYASLFPSIQQAQGLVESLKSMPDAYKAFVGDITRMATPEGYMSAEYFSITFPMLITILAISVGSGLLSKEEESGTIELLLASKVSRSRIVTEKLLAMGGLASIVAFMGWAGMALGTLLFTTDLSLVRFFAGSVNGLLLGLVFGTLAFAITAVTSKRGLAVGISTVVFIAGYVLTTLSKLVDWLRPYDRYSPQHYYGAADTLYQNVNWAHLGVLTAVILALCVLAYWRFNRRDIGA